MAEFRQQALSYAKKRGPSLKDPELAPLCCASLGALMRPGNHLRIPIPLLEPGFSKTSTGRTLNNPRGNGSKHRADPQRTKRNLSTDRGLEDSHGL